MQKKLVAVVVTGEQVTMSDSDSSRFDGISDAALMLRYKEGDVDAFNGLYQRYSDLKGYMSFLVKSESLAEDIFQETWIRIIKASDRYKETATFKTYFFTIMHRLIADHFRKSSTKNEQSIYDQQLTDSESENEDPFGNISMNPDETPEKTVQLLECLQYLKTALSSLPLEQRESVLLKLETSMSYEEIGEVLDVGRETVKSRLRYALKKLKLSVPEECYGD